MIQHDFSLIINIVYMIYFMLFFIIIFLKEHFDKVLFFGVTEEIRRNKSK